MKERLSKLLQVKSLVTLMLTLVFCFLAVTERIGSNEYMTIFTVIISFYFGTQYQKKEDTLNG